MKKYIKVILRDSHPQKIIKVSKGYALNYLIPKQIADLATKNRIEQVNLRNSLSTQKINRSQQKNLRVNTNINKIKIIHIRRKCGSNYQIFGSVNEQEIKALISKTIKYPLDKKQITIKQIKQLGTYLCEIIVNERIKSAIRIRIIPNNI